MPIGIFSRMTGLSHRALRLYADRGLLPPAHVDETTGYRYYDVHSIRAAEMIRLLRRLDVPLGEMRLFIDAAAADRLEETLTPAEAAPRAGAGAPGRRAAALRQDRRARRHVPRRAGRRAHRPRSRSAACAGPARWPARSSTSPTSTSPRYWPRRPRTGSHAVRPRGGCAARPDDEGLAGGDETVLRYELCLPVSGRRRPPAADLVDLEGGRFARSVFSGLYEDGYRFAYARQLEWLADSGLGLRAGCACASSATSGTRPTRPTSPPSSSGP